MEKLSNFVKNIYEIYQTDNFSVNDKETISSDIKKLHDAFVINFKNADSVLTLTDNKIEYEKVFTTVLQYIGLIDFYIFIANLLKKNYCLPNYEKADTPYIYIEKLYSPFNTNKNYVQNDFYIGNPNTMIITGPNNSGKSTYLYNVLLAVYLAQTLGISCCKKIILTPFEILYCNFTTTMNKDNTGAERSLFKISMDQCYEYYETLKWLKPESFMFGVMDELVIGSTIAVQTQNSMTFCENLTKYPNNLLCVATHQYQLTELAEKYPENIINKKFGVKKTENGTPYYPYIIKNGVYAI
jgi:DNA mismatch repair ATPase MutS